MQPENSTESFKARNVHIFTLENFSYQLKWNDNTVQYITKLWYSKMYYYCKNIKDNEIFYQFILLSSLIKTCSNIDNVWKRTGRLGFVRIHCGIMNFQQFDLFYNLLWCVIIVLLSPRCIRFIFFFHVLVISGVDILLDLSNICGLFDVEFLYIIPANEISKTLICEG